MEGIITSDEVVHPQTGNVALRINAGFIEQRDPLANFLRFTLKLDPLKMWFIAILYFGPFEKIILPALSDTFFHVDIFHINGGIYTWSPHIEALLTGFVEFPIFLAYYLWSSRGVAELFQSLIENQSFKDDSDYINFLQSAIRSFGRKIWSIISLGCALLVALVMNLVIWGKGSPVPPWFGNLLYFRILASINIAIVAYAIAQVLIRETLIIIWLHRLWVRCEKQLNIHPYHSDGAGGLGAIGHHALLFFYFVVTVFIFLTMATILPGLLQSATTGEEFRLRFWNDLLPLLVAIYFILIPLMFFLLIWPAHKSMQRTRDKLLNLYSRRLDDQLDAARRRLDQFQAQNLQIEQSGLLERQTAPQTELPDSDQAGEGKDIKNLPEILKEVNEVKNLRAVILEDYPTWPINADTKRLFGITSSLPTIYSIAAFVFEILR